MAFKEIILYPLSILYGFITFVRNKLFDWNIFRPVSFNIPIISVGNLRAGGTGKTPHVDYLIHLLSGDFRVAVLSRGYKRKSNGFILAGEASSPELVGDEGFQLKTRYPDILLAVDEKRVHGVEQLLKSTTRPDVVLLDDAFQHRWIRPGLSILLTEFGHLYSADHMLPAGRLREYRSGADRADIIIVTKTPGVLNPAAREQVADQLKPKKSQALYFSGISYGPLTRIPGLDFIPGDDIENQSVLLFTGIANPHPLEHYLRDRCLYVEHLFFPDHHFFSARDIRKIIHAFDRISSKNKVIVTTEKDMVRLIHSDHLPLISHKPFCYVPIHVEFQDEDKGAFENQILNYVKNH